MSDKACLTRTELELTQKLQMHFPCGAISPELLKLWNGCSKEILTVRLTEFFSKPPLEIGRNHFLKFISGEVTLTLDAVDGTEVLTGAGDVFNYIDADFKNWGADEKSSATQETTVSVHEMIKDGTYRQILGSLSKDFDNLCLTQAQIKNFVVKHRDWLRTDGYATFFAFRSNDKRFVARVNFDSADKLYVYVREFELGFVWNAGHAHRFVLPQLAEA